MLTLAAVSDSQAVGPTGLIVLAVVCSLAAAWFFAAALSKRLRAILRWSDDGSGPRMSAVGAGAFAACAFLLGVMFFAQAVGWAGVSSFVFRLTFASMFVAILVAVRDYTRDHERI